MGRWTWVLLLAWLLPGLIGHDPWKPDEAYSVGLVHHMMETGDWTVPTLAKEPFMEKPPLFFLTAVLTAHGFSSLLPLHDGARLAAGFYMALVFMFAALTGRELYGRGHGMVTMMILMGCIGLLPHAHKMITDTALLAGFSMALYGLALSQRRRWLGGVLLGVGTGVGFMSKGLLAPLALGGVVLILPLLSQDWRNRHFALTLGVATLMALPWLTLWPYTLYQRAPELFHVWMWENNLGRFFGFSGLATQQEPGHYFKTLPWFAWPALPLALMTLWRHRGKGWRVPAAYFKPALLLPLVMASLFLAVLMLSSATRGLYILPLLLPLALLATPVVVEGETLPHRFLGRTIVVLFSGLALLVWLLWFWAVSPLPMASWMTDHVPASFFMMREKEGVPFQGVAFSLAFVATGIWIFTMRRCVVSARRMIMGWTGGLTLIWLLLMTLWLPVIDYGKSYRSMVEELKGAMPDCYTCVASRGLGEPQRAMLHYFADIFTRRLEKGSQGASCDLLLVGSNPRNVPTPPVDGRKLWEGGRPGDRKEWYALYQMPSLSACSNLDDGCIEQNR